MTGIPGLRFQRLFNPLLEHLLPCTCLLCGAGSGNAPLCRPCQQDLPPLPACHCPSCLERTTHGERCGACQIAAPHFDRVMALHSYAFPVDHLVQQLKYAASLALARHWGLQLAGLLSGASGRVVPLPLHPQRLAERGYNQSLEIARVIAGELALPLDRHSLIKIRATRPQAELALKARRENLKGAFECKTDLTGAHVLLVDDVLTTGATLNEAARTLKLHGAGKVWACVIARTLRH